MEFKVSNKDGSYSKNCFISQVQDIISDKDLLISSPIIDETKYFLYKTIEITIPKKTGVYSAHAKIIKVFIEKQQLFLHIQIIDNFVRVQRREFFRLSINLKAIINGYGSCETIDISGNGMAVKADFKPYINQQITGQIDLEGVNVVFIGTVVRREKSSDSQNIICIHFNPIDDETQDAIVRFIHNKQLSTVNNIIP